MTDTIQVTPLVIRGLQLAVAKAASDLHCGIRPPDRVFKRDVYVWREGEDLAAHAERHANSILALVAAYRNAVKELEAARAVANFAPPRAGVGA